MFRFMVPMDLARRLLGRPICQRPRAALPHRSSLAHGRLLVEELEERAMLTLLGEQLFPANYPWNQNIANAPVAANSAAVISHIGSSIGIHPDWGEDSSSNGDDPLYGIPYNVVHGNTTAKVNVIIDNYPGESDIVPVPIPANAVIEGDYQNGPNPNGGGYNAGQRGDSHLLVWDEDTDTAYELYGVTRPSDPTLFPNTDGVELAHTDGMWHAAQETVWHMTEDQFRALGDTSADAAGLSILAGLARPDEGLPTADGGQGAIDHALRFTLPSGDVDDQYIYPASHVVGESAGSTKLPLGARLRLENTPAIDAQIAAMGPEAQIIAQAMQQYGLILADIGSAMYVTGTSASEDANNDISLTWNMDDVLGLHALTAGDFQVVNLTPIVTGLSTSSGSAGSTITINGQNFSGAAGNLSVFFGTTAATNVTVISDTQITAVVPSGTGTVNVTVQSGVNETDPNNPSDNVNAPIFGYGTSATSTADQFTFSQGSISPPVLTAGHTSINETAGQALAIDSGLALASQDANLTGATVKITGGLQSGDTLQFSNQNGITGSYSAGILTLSGTASVVNYQAALRSIQFSASNTSTTARTITFTADDASASPTTSNTISETVDVFAPITISGAYASGSAWNSTFLSYLAGHSLGNATYGFNLADGATQLSTLPWFNVNTLTVTFSGTVSSVGLGSLKLVGGSGGTAPAVTGFKSDGGNTYSWTLASSLTNNTYVFAIATTGSSFGTAGSSQVVDARGAGISGVFTTGHALPSGNGLAASTFDLFFNVLPGDVNRDNSDNGTDLSLVRPLAVETRSTSTNYNPYDDVNGDGEINTTDLSLVRPDSGRLPSGSPTAPSAAPVGGLDTQAALGVIETTALASSGNGPAAMATVLAPTPLATGVNPGRNDDRELALDRFAGPEPSTVTAAQAVQSADEAIAEFDLADLTNDWDRV